MSPSFPPCVGCAHHVRVHYPSYSPGHYCWHPRFLTTNSITGEVSSMKDCLYARGICRGELREPGLFERFKNLFRRK
jgi:hypothetical protein